MPREVTTRTARRVAVIALAVLLAIVLPIGVALVTLQFSAVGDWAAHRIVRMIVPSDSLEVSIGDVSGNWIGSLRANGVVLTLPKGDTVAYVDTLYLSYDLLPLLRRTVHLDHVRIAGPYVGAVRRVDSTIGLRGWNVPERRPERPAQPADRDGWLVRVDDLEIARGAGRLSTPIDTTANGGDGASEVTLEWSRLNVALRDLDTGAAGFIIDSASGRFDVPSLPPDARVGPLDVHLAARLAERRLDVSTLRIIGPRARVTGGGTVALPDGSGTPIRTDFDLDADSLPLAIVHAALGNPPDEDAWLSADLELEGTTELLTAVIDARTSDGATVTGTAALSLVSDVPVHYRADLDITSLDPARITGDAALAGTVEGSVDIDLHGTDRSRLNGTASASFDRFTVGPAALRSVRLSSTWEAGEAAFDLALAGDDVTADLDGTIRPFDAAPRYTARGPFRVRVANDTADVARFAGTIAIDGTGFTPDSANAHAEVSLSEIGIGDLVLERGTVVATLAEGGLVWRLDARAPAAGSIAANGTASFGERITYRVQRGVIRDLDIAAMLGDTVPSRIDAQLTASGVIGSPAETRSSVHLAVRDGRYGRLVIDTTAVDATLANGLLHAEGRARSTGGRVDFEIDAHPFHDVPDYAITRLAFAHVDLGAISADTTLSTDLTGTATGSGRGTSPAQLVLDLVIRLDSSRVNGQSIRSGEATVGFVESRVDLAAQLALADSGRITLDVTGRPFDERPAFMIEDATFQALDPFAVTGASGSASLNGSVTGRIEGLDPETMIAEGALVLGESRVNRETIHRGRVAWRVRDARLVADADVALDDGLVTAGANIGFGEPELHYVVNATLRSEHPTRLVGADNGEGIVDARITIDGRGTDLGSMHTRIHATADSTTFRDVRIDTLRLALLIDQGVARIDTLTVRSNVGIVTGRGAMPVSDSARAVEADLVVEGSIESLAPLEPFLGVERTGIGTGTFRVSVTGPRDALALEATANASALLLGATTLVGLESAVSGRIDPDLSLHSATGHVEMDRLSIGGNDVRLSRLDGTYDGDELVLEGEATVDDRRNVTFTMRIDPRPDAKRAVVERVDFAADQDQWQLVGTSTVSWADGIRVDSLVMRADDQLFAVNGVLDTDGESDLSLRVDRLRIGGVSDLLGYEQLDGAITASIDVAGPAYEPRIAGEVNGSLVTAGGVNSDVVASFTYNALRLDIDARIQPDRGSALTIEGGIPINLALSPAAEGDTTALFGAAEGPVDLVVRADSFSVAWAEPFLDPELARGMQGFLRVDARVTGTHATPELAGSARLVQGTVTVPRLGVTYRNAGMRVLLEGGVMRVDSASATAGGGRVTLSGTVSVPELSLGEFDIEARLDEFRAINTEAYRALASGTLALRGTTEEPRVEGNIQLVRTDIHLDNVTAGTSVEPVHLTEQQIRELEEYFGIPIRAPTRDAGALYDALTINVTVSMSRDTWVRQRSNPQLAMQLTGEIEVTKQPLDRLRFDGRIEAVSERSHIEQFGKRFSIAQGVVELRGLPSQAAIDIRAVYQVPSTRDPNDAEVTITLDIDGLLTDLSLTLGSEPGMENADIVSYLATGRPAATSLDVGGEGRSLRALSSEYTLGQVTGLIESAAEQDIGLDVIEIEANGLRGATLIAGRYVSPRLYVGFKQPVGRVTDDDDARSSAEQTEVELEYQAVRWLLLNLEASSSAISLLFRYRHAY